MKETYEQKLLCDTDVNLGTGSIHRGWKRLREPVYLIVAGRFVDVEGEQAHFEWKVESVNVSARGTRSENFAGACNKIADYPLKAADSPDVVAAVMINDAYESNGKACSLSWMVIDLALKEPTLTEAQSVPGEREMFANVVDKWIHDNTDMLRPLMRPVEPREDEEPEADKKEPHPSTFGTGAEEGNR